MLEFALLLLEISAAIAVSASPGPGTGVLIGLLTITTVMQRGSDFEDGIDLRMSAPPSWCSCLVEVKSFFNFWPQDRSLQRCFRLANLLAVVS